MIKNQKTLKDDKDKAIIDRKSKNNMNQNSNKKLIMISLVLFGLIIGANLACLYNRIFNKDKLII